MNTDIKKSPSKSFAFVMNIEKLVEEDSYQLRDGHLLRKAFSQETELIEKTMSTLHGAPLKQQLDLWKTLKDSDGRIIKLPEDEWRYYVIEFEGSNIKLNLIFEIFNIITNELEAGPTILNNGFGTIWHAAHLFHLTESIPQNLENFFVRVKKSDIDMINNLYDYLIKFNHDLIDLRTILTELRLLRGLPYNSNLRFLGYFAILESLLTHPPKPTDPYESITRQVKNKIALLNNRWDKEIDYSAFGGASHEKIWIKMYGCRSKLAHGSNPDFEKEFQLLGSFKNAFGLLKESVKSLIRYAIVEPQLIVDLKKC